MLFQFTFPRRERPITFNAGTYTPGFNPRSREGNDKAEQASQDVTSMFQSTFPRRERLYQKSFADSWRCFNPRSREGNDQIRTMCRDHCRLFQSTFPRRERQYQRIKSSSGTGVSIHVPAKGTTKWRLKHWKSRYRFNPRSREGNDLIPSDGVDRLNLFQSTFPRRERR